MRLGPRGDPHRLHLAGQEPGLERELVGNDAPLDAGLDLNRIALHCRHGGGEGEVLRGIVPRVHPEERDQITEPLDEGGLGVQAQASGTAGGPAKVHGGAGARNSPRRRW